MQGGTTSTTVPSTSNKISAVGGTSYTYDSAGNITAIGTNTYVISAAGLMKEYKISGVSTATYTYNAYNQRTKKVTGGVTTHYVYGAGGLLEGEYTSAGALVREYIYLNGAPIAQVTAGSPETVAYIHTDHLGTPRFATNTGGSTIWSWNNDAFGVSSVSGSLTMNLRMPGQYYDSESGLFNNWNRYYNSAIGRYISSDPIGLASGQLNTFGYVGQNPANWIDPKGLETGGVTLGLNPLEATPLSDTEMTVDTVIITAAVSAILPEIMLAEAASECATLSAAARAAQLANMLGKSKDFITIAVTDTAEGVRIISSSEYALRPALLKALTEGEVAATGAGHAEITGLRLATDSGLTPTGVAASRGICPSCAAAIEEMNIESLSPLKK